MKKICFVVDAEGDLKMDDLLSRKAIIDAIHKNGCNTRRILDAVEALPSAQPEYEPVTAEDFAKTMSENTFYSFMAWHGEALELMERQGFVICKKTM